MYILKVILRKGVLMLDKHDVKVLEKEIERLLQENEAYKKLVKSKRFQFAEKVANGYNQLFPAATWRGKATRRIGRALSNHRRKRSLRLVKRLDCATANFNEIIVLHSIPWNTPLKQRPHHLAKRLADQGFFVIYFEPDESISEMRKISNNIYTCNSEEDVLSLPLTPEKKYYFFFNNVSNLSLEQVRNFKSKGYKLVYEYIDEFHEDIAGPLSNQIAIWNKLKSLNPFLVLASANKLYDSAAAQLGSDKKILLSKNAVNVEDFDFHQFANSSKHQLVDIIHSDKPIIGYYGALAPWLDYQLIHDAAKAHPEYEFVFIGVNYQNGLDKLDQSLKNIHYLGAKKYHELPTLAAEFACAIIPFRTGQIAKGTSPVKLFEYMAAGLPTVVTRDLNECKGYDYVHVAKTPVDFIELLTTAVNEKKDPHCRERLIEQARANSWAKRAEDIAKRLKGVKR